MAANVNPGGGGGGGAWRGRARGGHDPYGAKANGRGAARAFREDLMKGDRPGVSPARGNGQGKADAAVIAGGLTFGPMAKQYTGQGGDLPGGTGGLLHKNWSSHPRYYEQKTAIEAQLGRALTNEEFERDYWVVPDSEIVAGTSIFDPVLCELAYRWFCPPRGLVLDPFAGGSVRGIVASKLGRPYVGVDLRPEQVAANQAQALAICAPPMPNWRVGDSRELAALAGDVAADFVFSCPPYADLEIYSDDPRDLSTLAYGEFLAAYRQIVAAAIARLKPDRFACFVVGDVRGPDGFYRGFPWHTVEAFIDAGAGLYNEAVLVTAAGSLPIRAGKQFAASRKLGKTHQNMLVFCKGDPKRATEAIGEVEFGDIDPEKETAGQAAGGDDDARFGERL